MDKTLFAQPYEEAGNPMPRVTFQKAAAERVGRSLESYANFSSCHSLLVSLSSSAKQPIPQAARSGNELKVTMYVKGVAY